MSVNSNTEGALVALRAQMDHINIGRVVALQQRDKALLERDQARDRIWELEQQLAAMTRQWEYEKQWRETRGQLPAEEDKAVKQLMQRVKELEAELVRRKVEHA